MQIFSNRVARVWIWPWLLGERVARPGSRPVFSNFPAVAPLRQREIHVADGLVDLLGAFEAHGRTVHACIPECEPHGFHTVVVTVVELTPAAQLHTDHA